jgi:hypothetical protein
MSSCAPSKSITRIFPFSIRRGRCLAVILLLIAPPTMVP